MDPYKILIDIAIMSPLYFYLYIIFHNHFLIKIMIIINNFVYSSSVSKDLKVKIVILTSYQNSGFL